ncbi:MAG: TraB/GumN family protein [Oligoflexus sp.]|nr:TraB/GumN family protein [Oligoflexus sp.]
MYQRVSQLSFLIILSIWTIISACVTPSTSSQKTPAPRQSFLWEAQKGDEILTLLGTMHIGITPDDMDPMLWQRIREANTVIIETDISHQDASLMKSYTMLPTGQNLEKLLGPKHWTRFSEIVAKGGNIASEKYLRQLTPLGAGSLLLQIQARADQDIEAGQLSIDQIIFDRAKVLGKTTRTLETNEQQMGYLKAVFTVDALHNMLDEWDEEGSKYSDMKDAFKNGDSKALDALLEEIPADMRGILLDQRNQNWIRDLPGLSDKHHTLIAVGAAHFAGKGGLLKLLEARGYRIKALH